MIDYQGFPEIEKNKVNANILSIFKYDDVTKQRRDASQYFLDLEEQLAELAEYAKQGFQTRSGTNRHDDTSRVHSQKMLAIPEKAGTLLYECGRRGWLNEIQDQPLLLFHLEAIRLLKSDCSKITWAMWLISSGSSYLEVTNGKGKLVFPKSVLPNAYEEPELESNLWLPDERGREKLVEEALANSWKRSAAVARRLAEIVRLNNLAPPNAPPCPDAPSERIILSSNSADFCSTPLGASPENSCDVETPRPGTKANCPAGMLNTSDSWSEEDRLAIREVLNGQQAKLFDILWGREKWTYYSELTHKRAEKLWRGQPDSSDIKQKTVHSALIRLQRVLPLESRYSLIINDALHRTKLIPPPNVSSATEN